MFSSRDIRRDYLTTLADQIADIRWRPGRDRIWREHDHRSLPETIDRAAEVAAGHRGPRLIKRRP